MRRIVQIALLFAIMIPFAWAVKSGVATLSPRWLDFFGGVWVGLGLCYALWRWDDRAKTRQREGSSRLD